MKRIIPYTIHDKFQLSRILALFLQTLEESPLQVPLSRLAYDSRIPESIFKRLVRLREDPSDAVNIEAEDFHIVFSNILFRYPTVKIWQMPGGEIFIGM